MPELFKLQKLTIKAFPTAARTTVSSFATFVVPFNPASFTFRHASTYSHQGGTDPLGPQPVFVHTQPEELRVDLIFDGTGVADLGVTQLPGLARRLPGVGVLPGLPSAAPSVADTVKSFLDACYSVVSKIHEPSYLKISWGKGPLQDFSCRLNEAKISYTAFARDGSPLRATVAAVFLADLPIPKKRRKAALTSADLSHARTVRAGDTLPLLCEDVYGSTVQHAAVARANNLDSLRSLAPGTSLIFPPLEG
jgi:hypothetical protein